MPLHVFTLIVVLTLVQVVICLLEVSHYDNEKFVNVYQHFTLVRYLTLTFLNDGVHRIDLNNLVVDLMSRLNFSMMIKEKRLGKNSTTFQESDPFQGHIMVVYDVKVLLAFLEESTEVVPKARGSFAILFTSLKCPTHYETNHALKQLWTNHGTANLIAFCDNIYVYHPFSKNDSTWGATLDYSPATETPNLFRNFNGYLLRVSLFKRPPTALKQVPSYISNNPIYRDLKPGDFAGLDGTLLRFLSNYLNFTVVIDESHPTHGRVLKNGTITGSLSDVVSHRVDFSANDWFLIDYQTPEIEPTVPFSYDQVCPVVSKALKVPQWKAFFFIFDLTSWVLIFFMWLCCVFVWHVLNPFRDLSTIIWEICSVLFGNPVNVVPLSNQHMFLGSCMVLNIIIMGIIQGSVFTDFTTTTFHKDINTLEELDEAGLKIASSAWYLDFDTTDLIKRLKTKQIRNYIGSYKDTAFKRGMAVLGRKQDVEHMVKVEFVAEDGSPLLHVTSECLQTFLLVSLFPKGSPFLPTFNNVITRLFEAGLTVKWYQDVTSTGTMLQQMKNFANRRPTGLFSLNDAKLAFYALFVGYIASFVTFLTEILTSK